MRQLQGMDASFVALETRNSPMHIGSILIYNPATAPGGFVRFKDILAFFDSRKQLSRTIRQRMVHPETDLLAEVSDAKPGPLIGVAVILLVGLASLAAGASLGPEAALVGAAIALGAWTGGRLNAGPAAPLVVLSSLTGLLVAAVVIVNLLVDLSYAVVDPRLRGRA